MCDPSFHVSLVQKKSRDIPQTLKCPMCNNKLKVWHCAGQRIGKLQVELSVWLSLLQEAMLLPCCKKSACRSCAERGLMKSRKNGKFTCNQCGSDRYAIKDLEPNYTLRAVIDELTRTQRKTQPHVRRRLPDLSQLSASACVAKQHGTKSPFPPHITLYQEEDAPSMPRPSSPPQSPPQSPPKSPLQSPPADPEVDIQSPPSSPPPDDSNKTEITMKNKTMTCLNCGHRV